jgi:hypothetical protein
MIKTIHLTFSSRDLLGCNAVYSVGMGYQSFGGPRYLHLQDDERGSKVHLHTEDGSSIVLRNIGILYHYTASQPGRPRLQSFTAAKASISRLNYWFLMSDWFEIDKTAVIIRDLIETWDI